MKFLSSITNKQIEDAIMKRLALTMAIAAISAVGLIGCDDDNNDTGQSTPLPTLPIMTGDTLVLTNDGKLASFNRAQPSTLISNESIMGLKSNDSLIGIDYRPADGKLYAVGHLGNIYTIDPSTSKAEFKVALMADATDMTMPFTAITGAKEQMAFDFNPAADRLRIVGNDGQNLRINVDTGATTTDGMLNGADVTTTATAYTNSFVGTGSTKMYNIDVKQNRVYQQIPPNDGTLTAFAPLGVDANGSSGFDIDGANNQGYAVLNVAGSGHQLYMINLSTVGVTPATNAATLVGNLPTSLGDIRGIALKPTTQMSGAMVHGLSANNQLVSFWASKPNDVKTTAITGLATGEMLVGIDYRLRTDVAGKSGLLYALSNLGNLYTINPDTGAVSNKIALTAASTELDPTPTFTALSGATFAVDFNPFADRLRVISDTGQNLRINVDNGATITDGEINNVAMAKVTAAAYTNSYQGMVSSTTLFDIDQNSNKLFKQVPPNDGKLESLDGGLGNLGITLGEHNGFDIAGGDNGLALATVNQGTGSSLYRINLMTGAATLAISSGMPATPSPEASKIGTSTTPALIDLAIMLK
jgi:hypothetical protein